MVSHPEQFPPLWECVLGLSSLSLLTLLSSRFLGCVFSTFTHSRAGGSVPIFRHALRSLSHRHWWTDHMESRARARRKDDALAIPCLPTIRSCISGSQHVRPCVLSHEVAGSTKIKPGTHSALQDSAPHVRIAYEDDI
eukprot:762616-Hanusia_phi.AAC.3